MCSVMDWCLIQWLFLSLTQWDSVDVFFYTAFYFSVKADPSQKMPEEVESAPGLGSDLTASVETTYSEQSSSSASSASSSDQPIYFRYENRITRKEGTIKLFVSSWNVFWKTPFCRLFFPGIFREFRFTSEVPIWLDYHGKHVVIEQVGISLTQSL